MILLEHPTVSQGHLGAGGIAPGPPMSAIRMPEREANVGHLEPRVNSARMKSHSLSGNDLRQMAVCVLRPLGAGSHIGLTRNYSWNTELSGRPGRHEDLTWNEKPFDQRLLVPI